MVLGLSSGVPTHGLLSDGLSFQHDSRVFLVDSSSGLCDESSYMVFGSALCFLGFFKILLRFIEHLVHGEVVVSLWSGGCFTPSGYSSSNFQKALS